MMMQESNPGPLDWPKPLERASCLFKAGLEPGSTGCSWAGKTKMNKKKRAQAKIMKR